MKILLVDDEKDILEFLSYNLKKAGYNVFTANNGIDALKIAKKVKPDLIVLDVMMPQMNGIQVCEEIRSDKLLQDTFVLFLTARSEEYSELAGFGVGADDYVTKPIKPKLLISRIQAILRRKKLVAPSKEIVIGDININIEQRSLLYNGKKINLAKKEFNLLHLLMTIPGKVFTREEIIDSVWKDAIVGDRTIDVHIRKIREKIGSHHIKTIKGVGYKLDI